MNPATQVARIAPGVFHWNAYSPHHKVDLTSHAVVQGFECLLFDPIPVSAEVIDWFPPVPPTAIVLTSGNHERASLEWQQRFQVPIIVPPDSGLDLPGHRALRHAEPLVPGCVPFPLPGGAPGETAYWFEEKSLMLFGDALVHLPSRGLELLPDKYCTNPAALRTAVQGLVRRIAFENAVFAHGNPLLGNACAAIAAVVQVPPQTNARRG